MRILDNTKDVSLKNVLLLLTVQETKELIDSLKQLLEQQDKHSHAHVNDDSYKREITVAIYSNEAKEGFSERVLKLIDEDL